MHAIDSPALARRTATVPRTAARSVTRSGHAPATRLVPLAAAILLLGACATSPTGTAAPQAAASKSLPDGHHPIAAMACRVTLSVSLDEA